MTTGVSDVLADCAARLIAAGLDAGIVRRVIAALRLDWGGSAPYIAKLDRLERDRAIRDRLRQGESITAVARQTRSSKDTVRKVKNRQDEWNL